MGRVQAEIPQSIQRAVYDRYFGSCMKCRSNKDLEYVYWLPLVNGGKLEADNVVLLCKECRRELQQSRMPCRKKSNAGKKVYHKLEDVEPLFQMYYNNEIGARELKEKLGYAQSYHVAEMPLYRQFLRKHHYKLKPNPIDRRDARKKSKGDQDEEN